MPLTPEDVVEKRFNPTRVREGYAQDEVDDFLDEVVAELRRLNAENAELRGQLNQCQARVSELTRAGAQTAPAAEAAPAAPEEAPEVVAQAAPEVVVVPEPSPAPAPAEAQVDAAGTPGGEDAAARAAGVIALAQRLHDEYVREGESQRDALVMAAHEEAERLVAEAEEKRDRTLGDLEGRRLQLQQSIQQLHGRETTYREQLEQFMATQLEDLRRVARAVPDDAVTS
ncbi:DivIVA domain-containing protein [Kineococcus aurantiacus]|uniref:Cell wall synthesis protein Wag31 n=1 Tax=Kineococcus aurantiacus TaxID=37633 RepID=A0A7Y9AT71_9ACTN|nr:DivIVA domain-containing protein [Kineococcus aurantiacus]NYD21024.1 DivIVA domain-containing protein [Kineococcus aurantiacus]